MDSRGSTESIDNIRVPTLPRTLVKLREMLSSDKYGLSEVAALIANDPPLAARTLRIANSAQYGLRSRTLSVRTAATVLGMRTLSSLAMQAGVISVFEHLDDTRGFDVESFWRHAILTGHISSLLATRFRRHDSDLAPEEYYTCGLLHDIGQLVMLDNFGIDYIATILISRTVEEQLENERERFAGLTHADVGAISASTWALPIPISDLIKFHHSPGKANKSKDVLQIIACADEMAEEIAAHERDEPKRIVRRLRTPLVGSGEVFLQGVVQSGIECWKNIDL
ncbi:MAG: HDOD domain-containing protein [Planctomycetota bacterium]|nr:HDOD domain-containing protein [Planctomycetota bacterium]